MTNRTKIAELLLRKDFGATVCVKGWVRTRRGSKMVNFIALNDGSTIKNVQIVADVDKFDDEMLKQITTGACLAVEGTLVESQGAGQAVEIQATAIEVLGTCDADYPMQKKGQSFEYMRQHAHLRLRTNTFGAVFRIRHNMAMAIHQYFHEHGFFYFHTPIITASDCEGAGQMFQVTTKNLYDLKKNEEGTIDYSDDFFGKMTSLTVSGQLEGELGATALGAIYTFGPTFRAENSNTPRHLAEFWMIEPEIAFMDLKELMDLEEDFIKYCVRWALDHCKDDLEFLNKMIDKGLIERLEGVLKEDFVRLPYTEGIRILQQAVKDGRKFEFPCNWGDDLASEHERYLVEEYFKKPVIMTNYPKKIKAFYMKIDAECPVLDGQKMEETVQGTDVLFPSIGEIIGGSVREESYDKLMNEIRERNIPMKDMKWYLDTRKYGSCPHAGFGLGFERLILFVTGMQNIRDVIPFPRTPKNAEF
ncbi:MAG: asparagine--tRNA ligase [Bacteroidales bacterium]|nr:asparagine--tRNA ligase [Bacteroidales bacterium]MDD6593327.1 asparagine--tRNA ligase [Bacteroidales bacterium]MDY2915947.1 asparagine--tRNA ligase [Alloprevotella sp.]MDY4459029.1 asparagine--tRNA ligase [Alloprevotella sp.]MDY4741273.1 asparagine--tRNA ligase [Alloprevotella sp.]